MVYVYIGGGRWAHGVPARDLSQDEWDALPAELQAVAVEQGLYRSEPGAEVSGQEENGQQQAVGGERQAAPSPLVPGPWSKEG